MNPSNNYEPYSAPNTQPLLPHIPQGAYAGYPQWYNAVPPPMYIPTSTCFDVTLAPVPLPQAPPGKQYYIPEFYHYPGMLCLSASSFERNGTTYYVHGDRTADGAFELKGTTFFPQSARATEEARSRASNTPAEHRPFPGSRVVNGTTYFPRVASDQILSTFSSPATSQPSTQTSTANHSPATEAADSINQDNDLPPLVFPTLN